MFFFAYVVYVVIWVVLKPQPSKKKDFPHDMDCTKVLLEPLEQGGRMGCSPSWEGVKGYANFHLWG